MTSSRLRGAWGLLGALVLAVVVPVNAMAASIASSPFTGIEDPLSENGAWVPLTSPGLFPNGGRFQKNNGAFPDKAPPDHAGAHTSAAVPPDHYSQIVVGHLGGPQNNVGPIVRVQTSGPSTDSHYLWWASTLNGVNGLYRDDEDSTGHHPTKIASSSPVVDGDSLQLIARGPVIYGMKNGTTRDFIYNTGADATKYSGGSTGILGWAGNGVVSDSKIASWSTGAAPASPATTWASSTFQGTEDPLDEGDRWYPLPGYGGFRKAAGVAVGRTDTPNGHQAEGVWGITAPPKQYSEVTLGTAAAGGGGPIVRIDRNAAGQTGWLLFLYADNPGNSGIYKMTPGVPGCCFALMRPFTPTIVSGDKWRLAADGNVLEVFRNGVSQFTFTTDGAYTTGDVGIEEFTGPAGGFAFVGWEGGDPAGAGDTIPPTAPSNASATATSSTEIGVSWTASTDNVGVTGYLVERCQGAPCGNFVQVASVAASPFNDSGLTPSTSYSYRVRATDAAGNLSAYSNVASATTQTPPPPPDTEAPTAPGLLLATPTTTSGIDLSWGSATDNVGVTAYLVERCAGLACGDFVQIAAVSGTTYSDSGLSPATSYSYRVRATDAAKNLGAYSNVATVVTLAPPLTAPSNASATAPGSAQVRVSWTASTGGVGAKAYLVERCQGVLCTAYSQIATVATASFEDSGLTANTTYRYRVRAKDAVGNQSDYSNVATAVTLGLGL